MFELLEKAGLKLEGKKCHFVQSKIRYLGHIVSKEGIQADPKKLCAMRKYPVPSQRNRYPETGCNGAPSLSIKTDFHVNFTKTFSDGIRVFMNGNRRMLPHGTAS